MAVPNSRVWEQRVINWLWGWHNVWSSVFNLIIGNQYTYCFTDRVTLLSSLIKYTYYLCGVCLQAGKVAVFTHGFHYDSVCEPRNLPCHWDKDRNGVRLVLLKTLSELREPTPTL